MLTSNNRQFWSSRIGLILAMAGNAVGLGNFLRFPVQAIQNGGGAFIIPYIISFLLMGLPLLWVEWAMGRYGARKGNHTPPFIFRSMGNSFWMYAGVLGLFINITMAAYYIYIESWTMAYTWFSLTGSFNTLSREAVVEFFNSYIGLNDVFINLPFGAIIFFLITLGINTWVLSQGIVKGIEKAGKILMPLLLIFGIALALRAVTLEEGVLEAQYSAAVGLNFLWQPTFSSLADPGVWLAAAGQVFFTLSLGMGTIICYASYIRARQDIALNAMSAGWINEFVEIVLGASIVIPITVGYMGLGWTLENAGFMMGFQTMPFLFEQWGFLGSALAGLLWFGLLFFAGITSSLSMGTPFMAFMQDEYNWSIKKSAVAFGIVTGVLGAACILFFEQGVFDEFDYWSGTVLLVVFAFLEILLFVKVFGMERGWSEITRHADIRVPIFFKYVIQYVTPIFIGIVLLGSIIMPEDNDWVGAVSSLYQGNGWPFDANSIISRIFHLNEPTYRWFEDHQVTQLFVIDMTRLLLVLIFVGLCVMCYRASQRRKGDETHHITEFEKEELS